MKRKLNTSELALLLLPVLFFAGAGVLLRKKSETAPQPTAKPRLIVSEVKLRPLSGRGNEGAGRVGIKFRVKYKGSDPNWWRNMESVVCQNMRFVNHKGQQFVFGSYGGQVSFYNKALQTYGLDYTGSLPKGFDSTQDGYFKGTVVVTRATPPKLTTSTEHIARFSVPVQLS